MIQKTRQFAPLCLALFFILLPNATSQLIAATTTHYVALDGTCGGAAPCHSTLQEAAAAAQPNDVIKVATGTYTGFGSRVLFIDKALTLTGGYTTGDWNNSTPALTPTIIDGSNDKAGVVIQTADSYWDTTPVNITNVTIRHATHGVVVLAGTVLVENSTLRNNDNAINNVACNHIVVHNNIIENNGYGARSQEGDSCDGIKRIDISQNQFVGNYFPIIVDHQTRFTITDNEIRGNDRGIYIQVMFKTQNIITNNTIVDNRDTALRIAGGAVLIEDNLIQNNLGHGIRVDSTVYIDICEDSSPCKLSIKRNTITGNSGTSQRLGNALYIRGDSGAAVETENNLIGNNGATGVGVYVTGAIVTASHWTIANSGEIGILAEDATVNITNSIVAGHDVAAFNGANITADNVLFHENGRSCMNGAICTNEQHGNPHFVDAAVGNFHIQRSSAAFNQADSQLDSDLDGDERPFCGGTDLGADEYVSGLSLAGLRLADAVQDGDLLTVSLTWPELTAVSTIELRYAPTRIDDSNWAAASVLAAGLDGTATSYTDTVSANETPLFFALKYVDDCGESAVSHNVSWPMFAIYLPIIRR